MSKSRSRSKGSKRSSRKSSAVGGGSLTKSLKELDIAGDDASELGSEIEETQPEPVSKTVEDAMATDQPIDISPGGGGGGGWGSPAGWGLGLGSMAAVGSYGQSSYVGIFVAVLVVIILIVVGWIIYQRLGKTGLTGDRDIHTALDREILIEGTKIAPQDIDPTNKPFQIRTPEATVQETQATTILQPLGQDADKIISKVDDKLPVDKSTVRKYQDTQNLSCIDLHTQTAQPLQSLPWSPLEFLSTPM